MSGTQGWSDADQELVRIVLLGGRWDTMSIEQAGAVLDARLLAEQVAVQARAGVELSRSGWLRQALAQVGAYQVRHRGNHRYVWPVGDRAWRRACPIGLVELPYPTTPDPAVPR